MRHARGLLQEAAVLATPPASAPTHGDAANQQTVSGSTTPDGTPSGSTAMSPFDINSHFSPTMIIILVILLSAFFFMGFFAVYVRRCTAEESISRRGSSRRTARQEDLIQGSGVDPLLVESYPMVSYVAAKKKGCNECAVCLGDFEGGEELKQLPKCKHVFHPACIGLWLESHTTCPLCRRSLVNSDRWSVSFRWGGSSRGGSFSNRVIGGENSRSRRGGASPWLGRAGSSMGSWLARAAGRTEDASSRGGAREETSIHVVDGSPSCELEKPTSLLSSSQRGLPAMSGPLSEVAALAEVAPRGLPASPLSSEVVPRGQASFAASDLLPREIQECSEGMPRGYQGSPLESEVAASGLHVSTLSSRLATNAATEVAQSGPVESRKPRQTAALQWRRSLGRSNSTGHSLRRAALQVTGCMPFSLDRSRSVGVDGLDDEEAMVGQACATSEHGPLSGSRCAGQIPHEACHVATSASPVTSAPFPPPP